MKKLFYGGLLLALVGIAFMACTKEESLSENTSSTESELLIGTLTQGYINEQSKLPAEKVSPFWRRVIGADLTGAAAGVIAGGAGGAIAGGIGAVPGAIIGGVLVGAGASFTLAGQEPVAANLGGTPQTTNHQNPYDCVGLSHYNAMYEMEMNKLTYMPKGVLNMKAYKDLVFKHIKLTYGDHDQYKAYVNDDFIAKEITFHANRVGDLASYFVSENNRINKMSVNALNILRDYSKALESTINTDDFVTYSIKSENIVVNSKLLSIEKVYILSYMSTARIGVGYYN